VLLRRIALLAIAAPRLIIAATILLGILAAVFGISVTKSLSAAGFRDPNAESSRAIDILSSEFGQGDLQMIFSISSNSGARSDQARQVAGDVISHLTSKPYVSGVASAWTGPPPVTNQLISDDGRKGLIVVGITGGGSQAQRNANTLADELVGERGDVSVAAGGPAMAYVEINKQSEHDLLLMESIAIPLSFAVLVWVFGGLFAAMLPIAVGILSIVCSMAALKIVTLATEVSTFALNLTIAMGLALAVDYTLLIVSRYRDERADGVEVEDALVRTMSTAGRTVGFSALTVGLSMVALAIFPMYFLKSFAIAGIAVVGLTAVAALVVTPAAIVLLGDRIDSLDLRRLCRRVLGKAPALRQQPVEKNFWYRSTKVAIRHAVPLGIAVLALLLTLGSPFLHLKWGFPDDRMLPTSASSRQIGDSLREDFSNDTDASLTAVIPDMTGIGPVELARYAADLSLMPDVSRVSAPTGTYVNGARAGPASAPTGLTDTAAFLTINSSAELFSDASERQLHRLHLVIGPGGKEVIFGGTAQVNHDNAEAISSRLPTVLTVMAVISFVLLFLLTGSVVLPIKALVLNVLSLTATFGALVWIFQDGHLGALGTTPVGTLVAHVPVLLFCIAFGLSMDYEVFLISRIREYWLASDKTPGDNDEAVSLGLARTGRVVTAAALLMSISFSALIASDVSIMRMFGLGLTLAVLVDATLVRMLLMPAFMHVLGRANWWAPRWMVALHDRFGFNELPPQPHRWRFPEPPDVFDPPHDDDYERDFPVPVSVLAPSRPPAIRPVRRAHSVERPGGRHRRA
jgi:RND superfamily putative drug exporter